MSTRLTADLRCPRCGAPLEQPAEQRLKCISGHDFPVVRGVPRFVSQARYLQSFGRQWNRWTTTQLDSRNGSTIFRDRFTRYFGPPERLRGLRVLDVGCGAGAFIDVVAPHAEQVVGIDLSDAVEAARDNSSRFDNVQIAQADMFAPPLSPASFDFVYCIGVLQHTPDPPRAFASIATLVKPGGRIGVWIYERSRWEWLKPRHLLRKYTTRLRSERAMRFVEGYAPRALRLRHRLGGLPGGGWLRRAIPVADLYDYAGAPATQLAPQTRDEWCVMDTHDMLITTYDNPQRPEDVAQWFRAQGFANVERAEAEAIAMLGVRSSDA